MKNIHIIPTNNKSNLFEWDGELRLGDYGFNYIESEDSVCANRHLYITCDDSINCGDFHLFLLLNKIKRADKKIHQDITEQKIILTTDPQLIKQGVQPIPDDFINWLISNPCDYTEVKKIPTNNPKLFFYKLIVFEEAKIDEEAKSKEFWSEEQTMNFLNYNETSIRALRNSKGISQYKIGHRYFYDPKEIMKIIEQSKVYEGDRTEFNKYIKSLYKSEGGNELSKKELSIYERKYILDKSYSVLDTIIDNVFNTMDFGENNSYKEQYIIINILKNNFDFSMMAEICNLSNERVKQIFEKGFRRILYRLRNAKNRYDSMVSENKEYCNKINSLRAENNQLIEVIKDITLKYNTLEGVQLMKSSDIVQNSINNIDILSIPISELEISVRTYNCLRVADIKSVGDILRHYKNRDLIRVRNFGKKSLSELRYLLEDYGLIN
jgi:hypothetical protein